MPNLNQQERDDFEAWYAPNFAGGFVANMARRSNGEYVKPQAQIAWLSFQAARRQHGSAAPAQSLIEAGALRQYRHNDDSEGFVFAYDKVITDRVFASLWHGSAAQAVGIVCGSGVQWLPGAGKLRDRTELFAAPPAADAEELRAALQMLLDDPDVRAVITKKTEDRARAALSRRPAAAPEVPQQTCAWNLQDEDSALWQSSCGEAWTFIDGGPAENSVKFCHGCGKPVELDAAIDAAKAKGEQA